MDQVYMEDIRADLHYFHQKISLLSGEDNELQSTWNRLQENISRLSKLLVTERINRIKEREEMKEARKLDGEKWMAKEMHLVSQNDKLKADLMKIGSERCQCLERKQRFLRINSRERSMSGEKAESSQDREADGMTKAVEELRKEQRKKRKLKMKNAALMTHIKELEEASRQKEDELKEKDEVIDKVMRKWKAAKDRKQKIISMSNEIRSKNLEINSRYRAMLEQKMEREREREINEREDKILSEISIMAVRKQRLMQELKEKHMCSSEKMSKKERKEWKRQQKAMRQERENNQERRSFWRRLQCWRT